MLMTNMIMSMSMITMGTSTLMSMSMSMSMTTTITPGTTMAPTDMPTATVITIITMLRRKGWATGAI